jgi:hypothetical protein
MLVLLDSIETSGQSAGEVLPLSNFPLKDVYANRLKLSYLTTGLNNFIILSPFDTRAAAFTLLGTIAGVACKQEIGR